MHGRVELRNLASCRTIDCGVAHATTDTEPLNSNFSRLGRLGELRFVAMESSLQGLNNTSDYICIVWLNIVTFEIVTTTTPILQSFSRTSWISRYQKGRIILEKEEMMGGSGISCTICKSFALCYRKVTTPAPHHSIFMSRMLFLPPNQQCHCQALRVLL